MKYLKENFSDGVEDNQQFYIQNRLKFHFIFLYQALFFSSVLSVLYIFIFYI
ncbi:hypothetical protein GCM10023310_04810 [Paenibacillus vulneris]